MSKTTENYGLTKPEVGEFFSLETWNENMDKIDGELKKREDAQKESDNSLMNPKFTEAKERKNLTSGEKIHLMLGKISKFFSDMKAIAFSGSYNDLVDKPKIPTVLNNQTTTEEGYALDARQANPNIDGSLAKQVAELNGSLNDLDNFKFRKIINNWSSASQVSGGCGIYRIGVIEDNFYSSISKNIKIFQNVGDYALIIFSWNGLETLRYGTGLLMSPRSTTISLVQVWEGVFILYDI